ncbi:MAG: NAD(P)H-dependent oxidoreductase [Coriobacteriia bacterium]|nr:NAD(P)H-dependent oxidoreductase [Coriobacteriia bacterium]
MNRLIIAGSPRVVGRTGALANLLFETNIEECPEDELALVPVSEVNVGGCTGCGYCEQWAAAVLAGEALTPAQEAPEAADAADQEAAGPQEFARCAQQDDMPDVYELLDAAEELTIVSPVYFAGPPAQLKALLDRLQPYYCLNVAGGAGAGMPKRPAVLHVVGEGGDPYGFDALVTCVASAIACAGFRLETVYDWVGKIDAEGEILEEAAVFEVENGAEEPAQPAEVQDFSQPEAPAARPQLRFDDPQVQQRGKASAEAGKRPTSSGKTQKRQTKGGAQTNNRNKRKENANRRTGTNKGPQGGGAAGKGGKGAGPKNAKAGKNRGN